MKRSRILLIDDETDILRALRALLERAGHEVATASNGRDGLRAFHAQPPDLVVLDVTMPELDGWQTLERIRDLSDTPILMLTARHLELEKVRGLRAGADDYLTKPFGNQELLARVEALLRRATPGAAKPDRYEDALLTVDFAQRLVHVYGQETRLSPQEFRLLACLVRHPNQVLSHQQLLDAAWDDPYAVSRDQVRLYVKYLRRKLATDTPHQPIETIRGFGYRYRPPAT